MHKFTLTLVATFALLSLSAIAATAQSLNAAGKCEAAKNLEAGKYAACLHKAEAGLIKTGGACSLTSETLCFRDADCPLVETCVKDTAKVDAAVATCKTKFDAKWGKLEAAAAKKSESCPDELLASEIRGEVDTSVANVAASLAGECDAARNLEAGKYAACLHKAEARLIKSRGACSLTSETPCFRNDDCPPDETCVKDTAKVDAAVAKCATKFDDKWDKQEAVATKKGESCRDGLLTGEIRGAIDTSVADVATALAGAGPTPSATPTETATHTATGTPTDTPTATPTATPTVIPCVPDLTGAPTLGAVPGLGVTSTRHILYTLFDPDLGPISSPVNPSLPVAMNVVGNAINTLDATGFVDPASCGTGTLFYHWVVVYQADTGEVVNPYTAKGLKGYRTPVLTFTPDSMPPGIGSIRLDVKSSITNLETSVIFNIEIDTSTQLVISYYLQCQLCALNPSTCLCAIDAALPADEPT